MTGISVGRIIWRWAPAVILLAFALALALLGGPGFAAESNVHAAVYGWAGEHPGQQVPVVIQTNGSPSPVEAQVADLGGSVKRELGLISAVQVTVPAGAVNQLAESNDVAYISLDAPVQVLDNNSSFTSHLVSAYPYAVKADDAWNQGDTGSGVGVAILDTGISPTTNPDFVRSDGATPRIVAEVDVNSDSTSTTDGYGHGTHVAGIVGSNGYADGGKYVGIAPRASLIDVKISDDAGLSGVGDLIAGLAWVMQNKDTYNIRVVNLSLHSTIAESYKTSPLDAAVEMLWKSGVVVVVASGNTGLVPGAMTFPPANDPFVLTVGAIDDRGTASFGDDFPALWSSAGVTQDGFFKPELSAPGVNIVSDSDPNSILFLQGKLLGKTVDNKYLKLSGTSMSAGVVSGVAALVSAAHPTWTPGQIKCSLVNKARGLSGFFSYIKVPRAGDTVNLSNPRCDSDVGIAPNYLLRGLPFIPLMGAVAYVLSSPSPADAAAEIGMDISAANLVTTTPDDPTVALSINTVDWSAIKWDVIKWDVIKWDSIKWDVIKWESIKWDSIKWDSIDWDAIKWDAIKWDSIKWDAIKWDAIKWDVIKWDVIKWDSIKWDAIKWDSIKWDSVGFDSVADDFGDAPDADAPDMSADSSVVDTPASTPVSDVLSGITG